MVRLHHVLELRRNALLISLYSIFKLFCEDLHLVDLLVSFKYQIKHFSSTYQEGNKNCSLDYKISELSLHLKTASYVNNIYNVYCVYIYKLLSKKIYSLTKEP